MAALLWVGDLSRGLYCPLAAGAGPRCNFTLRFPAVAPGRDGGWEKRALHPGIHLHWSLWVETLGPWSLWCFPSARLRVCLGTAVFVALAPLALACLPAASSLTAFSPPSSLKKVHQYFGWPLTWPAQLNNGILGYTKWPGFATEARLMRGCRL